MNPEKPKIIKALDVEPRTKSIYPEPFATRMNGRMKRALGDLYGIKKFGVNLTVIEPGGQSALLHAHSKSEEFIYVLEGQVTMVTDHGESELGPGDCVGFTPNGVAHMLVNRSNKDVKYIEIGDREAGDEAQYPQDDIRAVQEAGKWVFYHKDGTKY